jgi:hypothetical protein
MKILRTSAALAVCWLAQINVATANDDFWFGVKAGTLGLGAEAIWRPIEWLDVRAGGNFFDYDDNGAQAGINYDATLSLNTYYLTGNFRFPLSPFRLTAGAFANNNEVRMTSQDMSQYYVGDNGTPYLPAEVGTLESVTSFDSVAPYVGAGFDFSLFDRLGLSLDFGVLWQGDPTVTLSANGLLGQDPGFLADLEVERQQLEKEIEDLKAYPVVSLGISFNFR